MKQCICPTGIEAHDQASALRYLNKYLAKESRIGETSCKDEVRRVSGRTAHLHHLAMRFANGTLRGRPIKNAEGLRLQRRRKTPAVLQKELFCSLRNRLAVSGQFCFHRDVAATPVAVRLDCQVGDEHLRICVAPGNLDLLRDCCPTGGAGTVDEGDA